MSALGTTGTPPGGTGWPHWDAVRAQLHGELGEPVFNAWLGNLSVVSCEQGTLVIGAPKSFVRNWVANHYQHRITRAVQGVDRSVKSISIVIATGPAIDQRAKISPTATNAVLGARVLHPQQTFDTFVRCPGTELAHSALQAFARGEGFEQQLVYLHAEFGHGKSHLLNAAALVAEESGKRVLYLGAEDFMRLFLGALHRRETLKFKDDIRTADVLLVDDLQQIATSNNTVGEFLFTMNAFADNRKRIVIAGDRSPERLEKLGGEVQSRLLGGLVLSLGKPDRTTRRAILAQRRAAFCLERSVNISDEVLDRLADEDYASPRVLIGTFMKIATYADLTKKPLTVEFAEETLAQCGAPSRRTTIEDIQKKTAEFYRLDVRDMQTKERSRRVARPRQVAMSLSRSLTLRSLPEIGRRFGDRDHTTVLHACKRIDELCGTDQVLRQEVDFLRQVLSQPKSF